MIIEEYTDARIFGVICADAVTTVVPFLSRPLCNAMYYVALPRSFAP